MISGGAEWICLEESWRGMEPNCRETERRGGAKKRRTNEREMTRIEWKRMSAAEPGKVQRRGRLGRIDTNCKEM